MRRIGYFVKKFFQILFLFGPLELVKRIVAKLRNRKSIPDQNKQYQKWIENVEALYLNAERRVSATKIDSFKNKPKISILMPVYNISRELLTEAIDSIRNQWYENWELCINDDKSTNEETIEFLKELKKSDLADSGKLKIRMSKENENISIATNHAFDISSGEYLLLMDNDDLLRPNALYEVVKVLNNEGDQDLIYYDEDKLELDGTRTEAYFKPDYSPELLWSMMYPTHAVFSRKIFEKAGKLRAGFEGSQDYDLVLRVVELTDKIFHIPWVLYTWRKIPGSTAVEISGKNYAVTAAKKALTEALDRRDFTGVVKGDTYPFTTIIEPKQDHSVEIIIPIKDGLDYLKPLIRSIIKNNTWNNLSVTIVDNNSEKQETLDYLDSLENSDDIDIKILKYPKPYNFSAINNFAVGKSEADHILFLNNDIKILSKGFVERMLGYSQQEEIGSVGAKLIFPDETIQHAGVIMGYAGIANHAFKEMYMYDYFYFNNLNATRNYLAVTGAALMIEREKFNKIGGFSEDLPNSFNDIDLCLSLFEKGYRTVYIPDVEMVHYESKTRDARIDADTHSIMVKKWKKYIKRDPYYNPNLTKRAIEGPIFSISTSVV